MTDRKQSEFERALFGAVRELLLAGESVRLKGLGTFSLTHNPGRTELPSEGASEPAADTAYARTIPPRDTVAFLDEHHASA